MTPILRSFVFDGKRFVYGYPILFKPDSHGTTMRKEIVEGSEEYLRRFGSLRFMHREVIGKILWDTTIEGQSTYINDIGFHILAELYDGHDTEWNMITQGRFGFSFGFMPNDINNPFEIGNDGNKYFRSGLVYECSLVDAPSCTSELCTAYTITRTCGLQRTEKRYTLRGWDIYEILPDGSLAIPESEEEQQRSMPNPNIIAKLNESEYPQVCSQSCSHWRFCPFTPMNEGNRCVNLVLTNEELKHLTDLEKRISQIEAHERAIQEQPTKKENLRLLKEGWDLL